MKFIIILLLFLTLTQWTNSAKILGVFSAPGPSHHILGSSLLKSLAEKGHDVTIITAFGDKEIPKNVKYKEIVIADLAEKFKDESKNVSMFDREGSNPALRAIYVAHMVPALMERALKNEQVQHLINSKENFDVVIVEQFFNDAQKALATHFNAPLIVFSTIGANFWVNDLSGNPSPPSYVPNVMNAYSVPMSFCDRISNVFLHVFYKILYNVVVYPNQNKLIKKYIPKGPDIQDVLYNASLYLLNSHPSLSQPVPMVPNMIEIGGFHIKPPKKLPQDLQKYLDSSKDGLIYFSMGSNLKSVDMPVQKRDAILKSFSKLKQNVLWKWENDDLPGKPANVKVAKWLPQQDILAHPNVKLFITHGGLLSTTETIYHGVPILAIPVFGDQKFNARNAENNGFALTLPYSELSEETLSQNIQELLTNSKYRDNAKKRSEIFHDRQISPIDTAIYWVEYVIRHRGAPHLRVAGVDLPWYQYYLLDVIGFLGIITLISVFILYYFIRLVYYKFCRKNMTKHVKKIKTK